MRKMNIRKKILAALMAVNGVSTMSNGPLNAMEEVKSMNDFDRPLSKNVPEAKIADGWYDPSKLKTVDELKKFLDDNKSKIISVMHDGDQKRTEAFNTGKKKVEKFHRFLDIMMDKQRTYEQAKNQNKKWAFENLKGKKIKKNKWEIPTNEKIENIDKQYHDKKLHWTKQDNFIRYLSINPATSAKANWASIGRGVLKRYDNYPTVKKRNVTEELIRLEKGQVNCTIWAALVNWFLNENGYPAKIIGTWNHQTVEVPVLDENKKAIRLFTIDVIENRTGIEDIQFNTVPLCDKLNELTYSNLFDQNYNRPSELDKKNQINTIMEYLRFLDTSTKNIKISNEACTLYLNGLKYEIKNMESKGMIVTDKMNGKRTLDMKILPAQTMGSKNDRKKITIPLNIEYLESATTIKDWGANAKKPPIIRKFNAKPVATGAKIFSPLLQATFELPTSMYEKYYEGKLELFISRENQQLYGKIKTSGQPTMLVKLQGDVNTKEMGEDVFWNEPGFKKDGYDIK